MEVLRSIRQLDAIREDWNALADRQGHALLRHEWFASAARTLHQADELAVLVARSSGSAEAIAPLAAVRSYPTTSFQVIGAAALHEPTALLAASDEARSRLLDAIFRLRRPVMLQRLAEAPAVLQELRGRGRRRGLVLLKGTAPCFGIVFSGDGSERLQRLPGKLRYDLKRARTRAADRGDVRLEVLTPSAAEVDECLDRFMRIEASGWKGREGSALAARSQLHAFFRLYCHLAAEAGILRFFVLRIGTTLAAAQIAVQVYERLWVLKIAYEEALARCSPGFLLSAEAIWHASALGLRSYEFLGAPESWEERWNPEHRPSALVLFYPWSVRGCVSASIHVAGAALKRLRREVRRAS